MERLIEIGGITAPADFFRCPWVCKCSNGCDPKGWNFIPDEVGGFDLTLACDVHDCMYRRGASWREKIRADRVFFTNLRRACEAPLDIATIGFLGVFIGGWATFRGRGDCPFLTEAGKSFIDKRNKTD